MTETMGKQIIQLRLKGLGYQTIGTIVGTSKENVRYYCKTHGLMGKADLVALNHEECKKYPENCKYCGGKIMRNRYSGTKLFCSDKCRRSWWKEHPEKSQHSKKATHECKCAYCKRIFHSYGNGGRKYCSHDCYIKDRFWADSNKVVDDAECETRQQQNNAASVTRVIRKISA